MRLYGSAARHPAGRAGGFTWNLAFFRTCGATACRIMPNPAAPCQIIQNLSKSRQMLPNVSKCRQMLPNIRNRFQIRPTDIGSCRLRNLSAESITQNATSPGKKDKARIFRTPSKNKILRVIGEWRPFTRRRRKHREENTRDFTQRSLVGTLRRRDPNQTRKTNRCEIPA